MDKNNRYGNTTANPLPYGCIKKIKIAPSLKEFNMILNNILHIDKMVSYLLSISSFM